MSDSLAKYYENQAGSGISGFQGIRFQKGHNIFGRALKFIFPVLKLLGKQVLNKGISVAEDVIEHNKPFKESLIKRGKEGIKDLGMDGLELLRQVQQGKGYTRRQRAFRKLPNCYIKQISKRKKKSKKRVKVSKKKRTKKFKNLHAKIFNG